MIVFINKVFKKIWVIFWKIIWANWKFLILDEMKYLQGIQNLNYCNEFQKRILICYKSYGFFTNFTENVGRTLHFEIYRIVKVFTQLGFVVDIVDCCDTTLVNRIKYTHYHLIFGFGEVFYQMTNLQPQAESILYMTEQHPIFSLREENKRIEYYYKRHNKLIKLSRSGLFYKLHHLEKSYSAVITLGDSSSLFNNYKNVYNIFPTGIINKKFIFNTDKHKNSRNHFLWLGSTGVIHKGLDILVDIFSKRNDIILHICGLSVKERKLIKIPIKENIKEYGFIDVKSELFLKITNSCSYIILPSCSEAFSTAVVTGMLHGLIPVVTKNIGFDSLADKIILLEDYSVEYIDAIITKLIEKPLNDLQKMSSNLYSFASENFNLDAFENKFYNIITEILNLNNIR
jgi:glycosyltransferase involved in cell wall biosynthesis